MIVDINLNIEEVDNDDVDEIIRKNNYKLTADKIKQILSKILNDPSQSSKRWIWELMQNAKDLSNKFKEVSVKIEISENELVFRHNGNPFKIANITGLIQQVSSKDSGNTDEDVTGKFGTGFIATHLLSDIITVNGIVEHKQMHRDFEVVLDRSGRKSEDLLPKIEIALEKIRKINENPEFTIRENYDQNRKENDFDTYFTYPLINDEKIKAAKDGLADLKNTLPITLVNIPKIKSVTIVDKTSSNQVEYKREDISDDGQIRKTKIKLSEDDTRCFLTYYTEELSLSVEVNSFEELGLIEHFGKTPNLYRDFPLIGSDKFYFPFLFNGFKLHPSEDRDGIPIHSESAPDHIENRELVEKAFIAAQLFTNYLISQKAKNLYVCTFCRLPNEKWQEFSRDWYIKLQKDYRDFIIDKTIVETDGNPTEVLSSCVIPIYGETDATKLLFFDLVQLFKGQNKMPQKGLLISWVKAIGPIDEVDTWKTDLRYTLETFLAELETIGNIGALAKKLENNIDPLTWLNKVYKFLIENKETDCFSKFAIIPAQNDIFNKLAPDTLHLEDTEAVISDEFLNILNDLNDNWRDKLIHREVKLPDQNIEKKGLPLASNRINKLLETDEFRKNPDSFKIIKDILRNVTSLSNIENFRCEVFLTAKELFHFDENIREITNIKDFYFDNALDLFIKITNSKIQDCINITGLAVQLQFPKDQTIQWLSLYLNKIKAKPGFSNLIEYGNIVPNRHGVFRAFGELSNFGTKETPLNDDLIDILHKLDSDQDWKNDLVLDSINIGCAVKTFEELGSAVDNAIRELEKDEAINAGNINEYKDHIIELIDWCNNNDKLSNYLSHFLQKKNDLWVKFSMTDQIFSLLRDSESLKMLEAIHKSKISNDQIHELLDIFKDVDSIPEVIMRFAKEEVRRKKEFNNLLEVGSRVERLFIEALSEFEVTSEIIHAGGGAYDIRIYNPETKKSFYIEVKSCHYKNIDPISLAVSQVKRAVKELENETFSIVIIERSHNNEMDADYIKTNSKYMKNPGQYLGEISSKYDIIERSANTSDVVDLKMVNAEFKGSLKYDWVLDTIGSSGFNELIQDINTAIS